MSDSSFPVKPLALDLALIALSTVVALVGLKTYDRFKTREDENESDFVECVDPYGYWEDFAAHQLKCDCTPLE